MSHVVWHGTQQESFDLVNAIARNCTCEFGLMGVRLTTCAPHRLLSEDQRALNGLLFARSIATRLVSEEWTSSSDEGANLEPIPLDNRILIPIPLSLRVSGRAA